MFPIGSDSVIVLILLGLFTASMLAFMRPLGWRKSVLAFAILAGIVVWLFAVPWDGLDRITRAIAAVTTSVSVVFGWGTARLIRLLQSHLLPARVAPFIFPLALIPSAILATYIMLEQRVPSSRCTDNAIDIRLGAHTYTLQRDRPTMLRLAHTKDTRSQQLNYSRLADDKRELATVCALTNDGTTPLKANEAWIWMDPTKTESPSAPQFYLIEKPYFTSEMYGQIHILISKHDTSANAPGRTFTEGDLENGATCFSSSLPDRSYCLAWQTLPDNTYLIARAPSSPQHDPKTVIAQLKDAQITLLHALRPTP